MRPRPRTPPLLLAALLACAGCGTATAQALEGQKGAGAAAQKRVDKKLSFAALDRPVNLPEVFAAAARLDAVRALAEARRFTDEALWAECLLQAARAALEKPARPPRRVRTELLRRGGK